MSEEHFVVTLYSSLLTIRTTDEHRAEMFHPDKMHLPCDALKQHLLHCHGYYG